MAIPEGICRGEDLPLPPPGYSDRLPIAEGAVAAFGVATGDLDGDGDVDVITVAATEDRLSWHENMGDTPLTFDEHLISTDSETPRRVAVADFDRDGDLDLAMVSSTDSTLRWFENDGQNPPSFTLYPIAKNTAQARMLIAGDLNADGWPDLLAGHYLSGELVWYENNGLQPPSFLQRKIGEGVPLVRGLAMGDLDLDGDVDLIVGSYSGDAIYWFEQRPGSEPLFNKRLVENGLDGMSELAVADFDRDGDLDLVAAIENDGLLKWYENDGLSPPGFIPYELSPVLGAVRAVAVEDLDRDGDIDFLWGARENNFIGWARNDGAQPPDFEILVINNTIQGTRQLASSDLDRDGDPDVLVAAQNDDTVDWLASLKPLERSSWPGEERWPGPDGPIDRMVKVAGDGDAPERALLATSGTLWLQTLTTATSPVMLDVFSSSPQALAGGRFAGDGRQQFVVAADDELYRYRYAPKEMSGYAGERIALLAAPLTMLSADLDGTGEMALVTLGGEEGALWFPALTPDAVPQPLAPYELARNWHKGKALDLNRDGWLDLAVCGSGLASLAWLERTPQATTFTLHILSENETFADLGSIDLGRDGDADILVLDEASKALITYENQGATAVVLFVETELTAFNDTPRSLVTGDFDHDGWEDLIVTTTRELLWMRQRPDAPMSFEQETLANDLQGHEAIIVTDYNQDGRHDVLLIDTEGTGHRLFLQQTVYPLRLISPRRFDSFSDDGLIEISWKIDATRYGRGAWLELWDLERRLVNLGLLQADSEGIGNNQIYIPQLAEGRKTYSMRLKSENVPELDVFSEGPFAVDGQPVRVLYPQADERWKAGTGAAIVWKTSTLYAGTAVSLVLIAPEGNAYELGEDWDPDGEDIFEFTLPTALPAGEGYRVEVRSLYAPSLSAQSEPFAIDAASDEGARE